MVVIAKLQKTVMEKGGRQIMFSAPEFNTLIDRRRLSWKLRENDLSPSTLKSTIRRIALFRQLKYIALDE